MKLRADEIKNKSFKAAFRGYDKDDVKRFLASLSADAETAQRDYDDLKSRYDALNAQLKSINDIQKTIESTMAQAKELAEKATQNVEKEKELIIKESTIEAEKIIERAKVKVRDIENIYLNVVNEKNALVSRIKSLLLSLSSLMSSWEMEDEKLEKDTFKNLGIDSKEAENLKKSQISSRINDIIKDLE
jgi:cell division initiation protein